MTNSASTFEQSLLDLEEYSERYYTDGENVWYRVDILLALTPGRRRESSALSEAIKIFQGEGTKLTPPRISSDYVFPEVHKNYKVVNLKSAVELLEMYGFEILVG